MKGYLVTVVGDYFGMPRPNDRRREKFPYRIRVRVPKAEGALSLIKGKLLDRILRRNYSNYHAYRTHQLVSITNLDGSKVFGLTDPRLMDFNDLAEYVKNKKLPLKLELYTDLDYLRTMVHLAETNQSAFHIKQERLMQDVAEDMALAELNPEIYESLQPSETFETSEGKEERVEIPKDSALYREVQSNKATNVYKTIITQGEKVKPEIQADQTNEDIKARGSVNKVVDDADRSTLITENKPSQKVEKVYVAGRGYIPVDEFTEDFDRPEEKEFENYDPAGVNKAPEKGTAVVERELDLVDEL